MGTGIEASACPWRGPQPYEELDARRFFGRRDEVRKLLNEVTTQQLTILTAESGAGKTSLINAGLLPALRTMRERDPSQMGLALCLNEWGRLATRKPVRLISDGIKVAIDGLKELSERKESADLLGIRQLKRDLAAVRSVACVVGEEGTDEEELDSLLKYLDRLCHNLDGNRLMLVLDQAEEFMGSGLRPFAWDSEAAALDAVGNIFRYEPRVQVLVSLREEYVARLRPLDNLVPTAARRTSGLQPMTRAAATETVLRAAERREGVAISRDAVDQILNWASRSARGATGGGPDDPVDMLIVQAFLLDIYLWALQFAVTLPSIDESLLAAYEQDLRREQGRLTEMGVPLSEGPLFRRINEALSNKNGMEEKRDKVALSRRVAARMGSLISSPRGFKHHVTEADLVFHAVRQDLLAPSMHGPDLPRFRKLLRDLAPEWEKCERCVDTADPNQRGEVFFAAASKEGVWGGQIPEGAYLLVEAGFNAIYRLRDHHILKHQSRDERGQRIYSLVHDAFGPALDAWGEDARLHADDALVPFIGTLGQRITRETPIREPNLPKLDWRGSVVKGVQFEGVTFKECNFTGTWFDECKFTGCTFLGCQLEAAGFEGGKWDDVTLDACKAAGLLVKNVAWTKITLRNRCDLTSATVLGVRLHGSLRLERCIAHYAQIYRFRGAAHDAITAEDCYLHGALFCDYKADDLDRFKECHNVTEYTTVEPPGEESRLEQQ